jgi:plastocyanin
VSNTAPTEADEGQLWFDTDTGILFVYYGEWVQPSSSGTASSSYGNNNVDDHLNLNLATSGQVLSWNGSDYSWVSNAGEGGGDINQNAFSVVEILGQTAVTADTTTDTLTLAAGENITLTTDGNTVTITSTSSGASDFDALGDATTASLTIDKVYEPAITMFRVDNVGTSSYTFPSHYSGNNPTIYVISGTTVAFDLNEVPGHPFELQDSTLSALTSNLVHVATDGTVSTNSNAQGKDSGTLYWRIPETANGTYAYLCQSHSGMQGTITVKRLSTL